ncbi:MAG: hypothetical protein AAGP08_12860 [Pseudomonadota bacterium]
MAERPDPSGASQDVVTDLERARDWRRRRVDAIKMLPFLAILVFLFPLFLAGGEAPWSLARVGLYLFVGWGALIVLCAWLSVRIDGKREPKARDEDAP